MLVAVVARWRRHLRVEPLPDHTAPGARITNAVIASLFTVAESLGDRLILVVQLSLFIDIFPDHRVTRDVSIEYLDEALFELYCETTTDEDILAAFIP